MSKSNQARVHPAPQSKQNGSYPNSIAKSANLIDDIEDDSLIDLEFDNNRKPNYETMRRAVKQSHAAKVNGVPYTCEDVCFNFNPGSHYCTESSEKSDLTTFGVGILLYFKFLKHLMFFFFVFIILSIPALVIYSASYSTYNKKSNSYSYLDLLTATTVGSIGMGSSSCGVAKYPDYVKTSDEKTLVFQCASGTITNYTTFIYGLISSGTTCSFTENSDLDISCNTNSVASLRSVFGLCVGKSSCNVTVQTNLFTNNSDTRCNNLYKTKNIYVKAPCDVNELTLFNNFKIPKSTIAFLVAGIDVFIIVLFLIMIYTLKFAQKSATQNVLKKAYSASSYTVQLKNLPQHIPAEELSARLWTFLDYKLGNKDVYGKHRVVDIQIVLPNKLINYSKRLGDIIHEKNDMTREWMLLFAANYQGNEIDFKGMTKLMLHLRQNEKNSEKLRQADRLYKKIRDLALRKARLILEIQKLRTTKDIKIVCAFVTFSSIIARNKVLDVFSSSPLDRFARIFCNCCYDKDISFHGKVLRAMPSADPGSILWENLGEPGLSVFFRRLFSMFVTVCLCIISGTILLVSTYYKNTFKTTYPTIDCGSLSPTKLQTADDYLLGDYQVGLIQCYCSTDLISRLNDIFTTADNKRLCQIWFQDKVTENLITFAIIFGLLMVNFGIQYAFRVLSSFEKHSTLNKELAQRVIKTFIVQFLNTGMLILLINAKIDQISFWQGKFKDLTPLWYENVGSTLMSTMFINIFTVPTVKAVFVLLNKLQRWCDRRCGPDQRITGRKTQASYEYLYMGPEFIIEFRYSQILTLTFVCFLYSGGMPFLYITSFFQLVLTYYFDKLFLLRVAKLPKNYDEKLEATVRVYFYVAIVLHLVFTIFMLGQPDLFNQDTLSIEIISSTVNNISNQIGQSSENLVTKFFQRAQIKHNLIPSAALILVLAIYGVNGLFMGFLKKTVFALFQKDSDYARKHSKIVKKGKGSRALDVNFTLFHLLHYEDIASLIRLTKVTIKTTKNEILVNLLKKKLTLLKQEYAAKIAEGNLDADLNFIGFYTYDVRLNPKYKAQFAMEEMLDDEDLE